MHWVSFFLRGWKEALSLRSSGQWLQNKTAGWPLCLTGSLLDDFFRQCLVARRCEVYSALADGPCEFQKDRKAMGRGAFSLTHYLQRHGRRLGGWRGGVRQGSGAGGSQGATREDGGNERWRHEPWGLRGERGRWEGKGGSTEGRGFCVETHEA